MASCKPDWVEDLLRGEQRERFLQDSPILPDVWTEFAKDPTAPVDLLLTPFWGFTAGEVTRALLWSVAGNRDPGRDAAVWAQRAQLASNQSVVAVTVGLDDLLRYVLPLTGWWASLIAPLRPAERKVEGKPFERLRVETLTDRDAPPNTEFQMCAGFLNLTGALLRLGDFVRGTGREATSGQLTAQARRIARDSHAGTSPRRGEIANVRDNANLRRGMAWLESIPPGAVSLPPLLAARVQPGQGVLFHIAHNRRGRSAVYQSRQTIKADAVDNLFRVSCRRITWAILDTGIDATHPVFRQRATQDDRDEGAEVGPDGRFCQPFERLNEITYNRTRVRATFDFTRIRALLTVGPTEGAFAAIPEDIRGRLVRQIGEERAAFHAAELRQSLLLGREVDWTVIRPLVEVVPEEYHQYQKNSPLREGHGTHVAGVLGADGDGARPLQGVCPDIELYDLRVLSDGSEVDEFAVMCALQFVRYLNSHHDRRVIHGANLSLSFLHDVRLFACGRTPICEECSRLVGTGVVVVAAAGNEGWEAVQGRRSNQYRPASITDPGNAEGVITVGSTHRSEPHTYGISFFSSRGPTGDGRSKPDLVAPGEKVESALPNAGRGFRDGTSQAAPHVSGAAALLMARHNELIGDPARIKRILCETATDLGRERHFQGAGLVDVLRALQSL